MEERETLNFCGIAVFDFDSVDGIEGHWQYNNVRFHLKELASFDGECVEVCEDWKAVIWGDMGIIQKEFYIMDIAEFREKLYAKFPMRD
ncbi:hypothetical protein ACFQZE_06680 [Paenibacillus sp. GCM10027627]|uniref:hypothetical protein n=1 Tax=unclassified Paenibacillus TaxID=185978 RepID=UPI003629BD0A